MFVCALSLSLSLIHWYQWNVLVLVSTLLLVNVCVHTLFGVALLRAPTCIGIGALLFAGTLSRTLLNLLSLSFPLFTLAPVYIQVALFALFCFDLQRALCPPLFALPADNCLLDAAVAATAGSEWVPALAPSSFPCPSVLDSQCKLHLVGRLRRSLKSC